MSGPDFIGIGAQKAGTGWLAQICRDHPDIWMPPVKELHYFDRSRRYPSPSIATHASPLSRFFYPNPRQRMQGGLKRIRTALAKGNAADARWLSRYFLQTCSDDWYRQLFPDTPKSISGEITPSYMMLDAVDVAQVYTAAPKSKIIIILRDPVARAWSQIRFTFLRGGNTSLPTTDTLIRFIDSAPQKLRGSYTRSLMLWEGAFGTEQVFVTFTDMLESQPAEVCNSVYRFLGVSPHRPALDLLEQHVSPSPNADMPTAVRDHLYSVYTPELQRLAERFPTPCEAWLSKARNRAHPSSDSGVVRRGTTAGASQWKKERQTIQSRLVLTGLKKLPNATVRRASRVLFDRERRVLMDFSAKGGCTIATKMFFTHMDLLDRALAHSPWVHDFRRAHFYEEHPCTVTDLLSRRNQLFKVVRNPYDRVISGLRQKVRTRKNVDRITDFLDIDDIRDITFRGFVDFLESINLRHHCDSHYRIQVQDYERLGLRTPRVCKIETFKQDIDKLNEAHGYAFDPLSVTSNHHVSRDNTWHDLASDTAWSVFDDDLHQLPDYRLFYDRDLYERVKRLYWCDIDRYHYDFPWPIPLV